MKEVRYNIYRTVIDRIRKKIVEMAINGGVKRKVARSVEFYDDMIDGVMKDQSVQCQGVCVLENKWLENPVMLFPENSELLEMLDHATMDLDVTDLVAPADIFVVNWPTDYRIFGKPVPPALVVLGDLVGEGSVMAVSYIQNKDNLVSFRAPTEEVAGVISGELGIDLVMGATALTDDERKVQSAVTQLIVRLLVYTCAKPELVENAFPNHKRPYQISKRIEPNPLFIRSPKPKGCGTTHWRIGHFRRYPIRKDGERRKGIVAVTACVVNAKVEPKTILEEA